MAEKTFKYNYIKLYSVFTLLIITLTPQQKFKQKESLFQERKKKKKGEKVVSGRNTNDVFPQ